MISQAGIAANPIKLPSLLVAILVLAIACGTAEEQERTGPSVSPPPTATLPQLPTLVATASALPTSTRVIQPTPTRFVASNRATFTAAPTPVLTPTRFSNSDSDQSGAGDPEFCANSNQNPGKGQKHYFRAHTDSNIIQHPDLHADSSRQYARDSPHSPQL